VAKLRAGTLAGYLSRLFRLLLKQGHATDNAQIDALIRRWTAAALEAGEMERATRGWLSDEGLDSIAEGLGVALEAGNGAR